MKISATVNNTLNDHQVIVETNGSSKTLTIPPKARGFGSSVNGGELLMLALATCFCNDLYREASKLNILVRGVEVKVTGNFGADGEAGTNFQYDVKVKSDEPGEKITALIQQTDRMAEVQNTLRKGIDVTLIGN